MRKARRRTASAERTSAHIDAGAGDAWWQQGEAWVDDDVATALLGVD